MRFIPINTRHWRWLTGKVLYVAFVVLLSCAPMGEVLDNGGGMEITPTVAPAAPEGPLPITVTPADEDMLEVTVFFTDPYTQPSNRQQGGLDELLVQAINQAQSSVAVAMYNLSLENVSNALLRAAKRGVWVRLVMESDALDGVQPQRLMDNGIPVISDQLESMMHNKYLVIDEQIVWTGSANLTYSGIYHDHNHLIMLRNDRIVRNYKVDFDEMFAGNFGNAKRRNTPFPIVEMNAATVENYFSPEDKPLARLVELVSNAQAQIHFLAYSFTSDDLAEAIINRAGDGVDVRGVLETQQVSNQGGEYERFRQAGLDVRLDGLEGQMHHKVIIVDGKTVVTGSYNFTNSAERYNEENVLIIHSEMLAKQYEAEFERIYARANP